MIFNKWFNIDMLLQTKQNLCTKMSSPDDDSEVWRDFSTIAAWLQAQNVLTVSNNTTSLC